MGKWN